MNEYKPDSAVRSASANPYRIDHLHPQVVQHFSTNLLQSLLSLVNSPQFVCVCVGTDRSTGDALGPLVGSKLERLNPKGLTVFGTLDHPVHAVNLQETLKRIKCAHPNSTVIGIDACLGQMGSVGMIQLGMGPLKPGAGVNKKLPDVGQLHITGIVNVGGFMEYFVLQNTRLNRVMKMADAISSSIYLAALRLRDRRYTCNQTAVKKNMFLVKHSSSSSPS